jgi:anaerobic magnesium-protoporphyrin IX monomethyl ester cyclase
MTETIDLLLVNPSLDPRRRRDAGSRFFWVEAGHSWIPQFAVWLVPYLRARGFAVKVLDMELVEAQEESDLLARWVPAARFVGFSVMTATIPHALALTRATRAIAPATPVVWGGIHPTLLPQQTLAHPLIDFVVTGEGEEPAAALLAGEYHPRLASKRQPPASAGLRAGDFLAPESLPDPDYSFLEIERYFELQGPQYRNLELLTSRGCPHRCSFCVNTITRNRWRALPAGRITSLIPRLHASFALRHLFIADENFFGDVRRAVEIIEAIRPLGITWESNVQIGTLLRLPDEVLSLMRASGAVRLRMGAESGSDRLLAILRKGITVGQIAEARDRCLRFGITPAMSFMVDLPDETIDEKAATIQCAQDCADAGAMVIGPQSFRPYPGSLEFSKVAARGLRIPLTLEEWAASELYTTGMAGREDPRLPVLAERVEAQLAAGPSHHIEICNRGAWGGSLASEVWIYDVSSEVVPYYDLELAERRGGWAARPPDAGRSIGPIWMSSAAGDALSFRLPGRQLRLRLLRHPWSGCADVRVDGTPVRTVALYAPQSELLQLCFDVGPTGQKGGVPA